MLTVEESVVIDKPRSEVFAFFAEPENVVVTGSNISSYEIVSGENTEVGRKAQVVVRVAGVRLEGTDELVEYEEGSRIKLVSDEARIPYSILMTFADEGNGTKVTWHQESESLKGVFKFADQIVLKLYGRDVRSSLEKSKTLLEA